MRERNKTFVQGEITMKKKVKIPLIVALILFTCACLLVGLRKIIEKTQSKSFLTYTVKREIHRNTIEVAGTVDAVKTLELRSRNDGTVTGVYVKEGQRVKAGDVIIQLNDATQKYNLSKAEYNLRLARENQTAGYVQMLENQVADMQERMTQRQIIATFDGVIANLDVEVGDYLEAKDSIGTLVDVSSLTADVEVVETDVSKLKINQRVEMTFPAYPETVIGHVTSFPAIGKTTSRGTTVVMVKIQVDEPPKEILPNYSFTGSINITKPENRLVVERYAIGRSDDKSFAEIIRSNGTSERVDVKIRPYGTEFVLIDEGLKEGDVLKAQSDAPVSGGKMKVQTAKDNATAKPPLKRKPPKGKCYAGRFF